MFEKWDRWMSGWLMIGVSALCLLLDVIPMVEDFFGRDLLDLSFLPGDPAWLTIAISGYPLVYEAASRLCKGRGMGRISSALLITMAMMAAIGIGDLFAAAEVALIMAIGEMMEKQTTNRAKRGIEKLLSLVPTMARRLEDGKEVMVPLAEVRVGDRLRIIPGEHVPVDGKIIFGETSIDQSLVTGESMPVEKKMGDSVFCGTVNYLGTADIVAEKVGNDSSIAQMIRMVREAEARKAPAERMADKAASYFVPAALLLSVLTYFFTGDIMRAVTILVVFCPCALVLATPTAIMAAIGQAARHGIIIKSGESLEKLGDVNTIAFDKTGTLTHGKPEVTGVISFSPLISEEKLLQLAATVEGRSEHPLGRAVCRYALAQGILPKEISDFRVTPGRGIEAAAKEGRMTCGSLAFMEEKGFPISTEKKAQVQAWENEGKAVVLLASEGQVVGLLGLSDMVKTEARSIVEKLQEMKIRIVLLTGDNSKTARYFATLTGIVHVFADLLPHDKVNRIRGMESEKRKVCMVGDGINDAPALKSADVGIAMGRLGSDIAVDAADIVLLSDDISKLPYLKRLAKETLSTIKLSISLSMVINLLAVACSVMGLLTPTTGALVHNAGSCFVIFLAAMLYDKKLDY